jgi:RNA polymerase sigma factor (sigma-70 family)
LEVSALKYSGGIGLHGRSPLLRLQSDERLIGFLRRGNMTAFEVLVSRYETRLMAFCRHLLGSREDAEDVLQEVLTAAFNAILADDRPINVRPWLYRIARNRSLNHLRRIQAIGVDSMDHHLSEHGASTADKVHEREEFRLLVGDIHELPETQKTALVLREMDAMPYEQIAEAMETTVPSVKSLLVRARVSLAEASEARLLSCDEVRIELAEIAEGLQRRPSPLVRRHLRNCKRCSEFRSQLKATNKALAALLPLGPLAMLHKLLFVHLGHSASAGSGAAGAGSTAGAVGAAGAGAGAVGAGAAGAGAAGAGAGFGAAGAGSTLVAGSSALASSSGLVSAGIGAFAGKAAAGLAAAALVTAGAVEVDHGGHHHASARPVAQASAPVAATQAAVPETYAPAAPPAGETSSSTLAPPVAKRVAQRSKAAHTTSQTANAVKVANANTKTPVTAATQSSKKATTPTDTTKVPAGRTQTQSDPTVLPSSTASTSAPGTTSTSSGGAALDPYPAQTAQTTTAGGSAPGSTTSTPTSTSPDQTSTSTSDPSGGSQTGTTTPTGTTPPPGTTLPPGTPATGTGDPTSTTTPSPVDGSPPPSLTGPQGPVSGTGQP